MPLDFDPENHLVQVNQGAPAPIVAHGTNGDGLRAWKLVGTNASARTYFLYDGSQPILEVDSTGSTIQAINTFGANGLLSRSVTGGTNAFYTFDPQGSVCQRFGSGSSPTSSDAYDAYGALVGQTPANVGDVFGYGAQYGDYTDPEDGLVLMANRYYDPGLGRFLSRDPLGQAGGANLYGYAGSNPSTYADPLGLFITARQGAGAAGAALGAFGGPIGAGLGYLGGLALYDAVNELGNAIGCHEGGYASNRDVAGASINLALAAATVVPGVGPVEDVGEAEGLAARATQVHKVLDPFAQTRRTTAVLRTDIGTIVAGGAKDQTGAQVAAVEAAGEIAAAAPGLHAETTALQAATELGGTPQAIAASRPFCPACRAEIEASGGRIVAPNIAVWPK